MAKKKKAMDIGAASDVKTKEKKCLTSEEIINALKKDKELNKLVIDPETMKYEWLNTNVISLNLVFGGKIRGGIKKGAITSIAADSQLGKSLIGYNVLQSAYRSGMACVVIDTEHAINLDILKQLGIDLKKIVIYQTSKINELKQIFARINHGKTREESLNTFVLMDSWGPIVEVQVLEKAEEASSSVNMSAPKFKNELANIINACGNTTFIINHVYASLEMYGEKVKIPGGKRLFFNSDSIGLCSSAAKYKDAQDNILGKVVTVGVKKGRGAKEFLKTQYLIRLDGGLDPFFGLLDDAIDSGCVFKPQNGYYARTDYDVDKDTGEVTKMWKESELYCAAFWVPLYRDQKFVDFMEDRFSFVNAKLISSQVNVMDLIDGAIEITDESLPTMAADEEEQFRREYGDENEDAELDGTGIFQKYSAEEIAEAEAAKKNEKKVYLSDGDDDEDNQDMVEV